MISMKSKRRITVIVALISAIMVMTWLLRADLRMRSYGEPSSLARAPRFGGSDSAPGVLPARPWPWRSHLELGNFTRDEARAYALLGQLEDGSIDALPPVSKAVAVEFDPMRSFLAEDRAFTGEGRTIVTPGGSLAVARDNTKNGTDFSAPSAMSPLAAARVPTKTELVPTVGDIRLTSEGQIISGRGVWAAIRLDPSRQDHVRIVDRGQGGYAICLRGDDFGTVRVNGGLVVPGRYYAIDGQVDITSQAPVGIDICPIIATLRFYGPPLPPPTING